ncbi:hypothetical protein BKA64DRAFT_268671 [Cadophora sp. MPI-SDFR-AT-0126]|nr:hypothetical protein BKA64DRAFT_268671 [Leotiomycetes sp. MPI-SDFR-AT-0126]
MSANIHSEVAASADEPSTECIKVIGILSNKRLPSELRVLVFKEDFMAHITSSISNARSPLFLALNGLVASGSTNELHHEMYADVLELWENKENSTFLIGDTAALTVLDKMSRQDRLAINHLVFVINPSPMDYVPNTSFRLSLVGQKITISNNLQTICVCMSPNDPACDGLEHTIGVQLRFIIRAAAKTLQKVVIELPPGCVYESRVDQFLPDKHRELGNLDCLIGADYVLEKSPSGALFHTWNPPFEPFSRPITEGADLVANVRRATFKSLP